MATKYWEGMDRRKQHGGYAYIISYTYSWQSVLEVFEINKSSYFAPAMNQTRGSTMATFNFSTRTLELHIL